MGGTEEDRTYLEVKKKRRKKKEWEISREGDEKKKEPAGKGDSKSA